TAHNLANISIRGAKFSSFPQTILRFPRAPPEGERTRKGDRTQRPTTSHTDCHGPARDDKRPRMRRIVVHRPGGFDKLRLETEPDPVPGPGTVHVTTRSIGVNYADCVVRMGLYSSAREFVGFPITPGFEFSGVVAEVGAGVTDFRPGDTVMGVTQFGAYASAVVVPQEQLVRLPPELGMVEAGGFSVAFLTAWYAVLELCRLSPGDRVLVHSAAGGVGSAIVKLARAAGCEVLGVVGAPHKVDVA